MKKKIFKGNEQVNLAAQRFIHKCLQKAELAKKEKKDDDRQDFYQLMNEIKGYKTEQIPNVHLRRSINEIIENAKSVVMVVHRENIYNNPYSDEVIIDSLPLYKKTRRRGHRICKKSKFGLQRSALARGSGFFIKENMIASAAHVFINVGYDIRDYYFVHHFLKKDVREFQDALVVHKSQIWKPTHRRAKLSPKRYFYQDGEDWALINVKRAYPKVEKLAGHEPTYVNFDPKRIPKRGDIVYAFGHGFSLPLKFSPNGKIFRVDHQKKHFECALTLVGGNSGCPIFYADDHSLAGLHPKGINLMKLIDPVKKEQVKVGDNEKCLTLKKEYQNFEGQEVQFLTPIIKAINKI